MRILIATDGSPGADAALQLVAASFHPAGVDGIDVVTVAARDPDGGDRLEAEDRPNDASAAEIVEAARARLAEAGFAATGEVLTGHPADEIVERAGDARTDFVVVGTRGAGLVQRLFAGSVSSKVAAHSPAPVLVAERDAPIRRVLVAYDGSAPADAALRFAAALPLRDGAEFRVATVFSAMAPLSSGIAPTMVGLAEHAYAEELETAERQAVSVAEAGAAIIRAAGRTATATAISGPPLERLTELASEFDADLIAVGDRGRSGIQRFLLGSTSAGLVTSPPTNILVVRNRTSA
jgi:nucleotide-binding universal stress UspA family protein